VKIPNDNLNDDDDIDNDHNYDIYNDNANNVVNNMIITAQIQQDKSSLRCHSKLTASCNKLLKAWSNVSNSAEYCNNILLIDYHHTIHKNMPRDDSKQ